MSNNQVFPLPIRSDLRFALRRAARTWLSFSSRDKYWKEEADELELVESAACSDDELELAVVAGVNARAAEGLIEEEAEDEFDE